MESVTEFLNQLARKGVKLSAEAGQLHCYAPQGTLATDIRDGIVRYKSEIIAFLEDGRERLSVRGHDAVPRVAASILDANQDPRSIRPADRAQCERLPLSIAQERVWFFDQLAP